MRWGFRCCEASVVGGQLSAICCVNFIESLPFALVIIKSRPMYCIRLVRGGIKRPQAAKFVLHFVEKSRRCPCIACVLLRIYFVHCFAVSLWSLRIYTAWPLVHDQPNRSIKSYILLMLLVLGWNNSYGQEIEWRKIHIDSVDGIDVTNDSIIDTQRKPDIDMYMEIDNEKSGLVFRVTSTPSLWLALPDDWKEYSDKIEKEYIKENKITDNKHKAKQLALIKKGDCFILKEFQTEVGYYFEEGGGVRRRVAIVGKDAVRSEDIFLMFNKGFSFPQRKICSVEIESGNKGLILPENEIVYKDPHENLTIRYSGILNKRSFQHGGGWTVSPTYINVSLSVENSKSESKQELYKLPSNVHEGIGKIVLLDINGDSHKDIVLEIEDEMSHHRLLYLSKAKGGKVYYEYMGVMEIIRYDP